MAIIDMLIQMQYWRDLEFEHDVEREVVLQKLKEIKQTKKTRERKSSESKRLLIELLFAYKEDKIMEKFLLILYNGILYPPKIKSVSKKKVKLMLKH